MNKLNVGQCIDINKNFPDKYIILYFCFGCCWFWRKKGRSILK